MLLFNRRYRILHRRGALFAGQISGVAQPVQLQELDLLLLAQFVDGGQPETVAGRLQAGQLAPWLPAVPPAAATLGRIRQLAATGLLQPGEAPTAGGAPATTLADCAAATGDTPRDEDRLRLGANLALLPVDGGFQVWSPVGRRFYLLGLDLLMLLMSFTAEKSVADVVRQKAGLATAGALGSAVAWLWQEGLLRPPARQLDAPAEVRQSLFSANATDSWETIQPDGRIPIYLTPHMENHFPLALGMIASAIRAHDSGALLERYQLLPITYQKPADLLSGPYRKFGPGVWMFSNYMWSLEVNLQISAAVKQQDPRNLTIHGGPSTPGYAQACAEFMAQNPSVDIAVHGEGEMTAVEILEQLSRSDQGRVIADPATMGEVRGITLRAGDRDELLRTGLRARMKEPDSVPSPYLEGLFDGYRGAVEAAIIESNRGCPFGCTFCDWGSATQQKVRKFDLDRVKREIHWIGSNKVRVLWIADANFGMYDRDVELARYIVETRKTFGYPKEVVVNYTKNTTRRLVDIIRAFSDGGIISQGIISIQTTDEQTLDVINRRNIKTEKYDELTRVFADANLPLSTDLMIGLPGITPEAFDRDLQRYFDVDVSTKAYPTQLLPNSPMADPDYIEKYRIEVDEDDFVVSCHSFNRQELDAMKATYNAFTVADGYATLRYVLRFLQWEHQIKALDFLHRLQRVVNENPSAYPAISWALSFFTTDKFMPGGWKGFYDEVARLIEREYGISRDDALDTVLLVNELVMPDDMLDYPLSVRLPHDFTAWFRDRNGKAVQPDKKLADYPPGDFLVDDPDGMVSIDMDYVQYDSHQFFWELRSPTARAKSVSDVKELKRG
ncbi:MAG: radical SAM protein [Xanthomonadales bacterium]|nr:radical SAM protein [Xanthomonadales bacterium]